MVSFPEIPIWLFVTAGFVVILVLVGRSMSHTSIFSLVKKNFFYFFLFLFIALFTISAVKIHSTHSFDFKTLEGWKGLFKVYLGWFGHVIQNFGKITGYAIQQDWVASSNESVQ